MIESAKKLPDTNVILRYLLEDEPQLYQKASEFFEKVRLGEEKALIIESVLVECIYMLTKFYKVPKEVAVDKLKGFLQYKGIINEDKKELIEAMNIFSNKNIDIVDCILCTKAKSYNKILFTFDEGLRKGLFLTSSG
ncbi:MAG: PIN domain-containing protein [Nitrospirota bacterium]|nr:PIN domain-containing protein [Nitrospirota bacterium]